jgi:hypothetical protein
MRKERAIHDVVKTEHFGGERPALLGGAWLLFGLASAIFRHRYRIRGAAGAAGAQLFPNQCLLYFECVNCTVEQCRYTQVSGVSLVLR